MFLVSKVLPSHARKRAMIAACENSLARLKTDRLDCYLLHWPSQYPLAETIEAFESLVTRGKILSWGVSNFDVDDLEEVRAIAGDGHPACNQVLYHLQERAIEHTVLPWCREHGAAVVAYTPFGQSRERSMRRPVMAASSRRLPPRTERPHGKSRSRSCCATPIPSSFPRRRTSRTSRRMRVPPRSS